MNEQFENLMYHAGLTASGCWDQMDSYDHTAIEKFAELIVAECAKLNKKQSYELSGVIADTEEFGGFDLVCLDTVKRVEQYLASDTLINHFNKKDDIL